MINRRFGPEAFSEALNSAPPANTALDRCGSPAEWGGEAGPMTEQELLDLMRKHCQKSWQATRWLLEIKFPELYGKRKGNNAAGPDIGQLLGAVSGVLAEEIVDEELRGRIEVRLDKLSAQEFAATPVPAMQPPKPDDMIIQQPASGQNEQPQPAGDASPPVPVTDEPELPPPAAPETLAEHAPPLAASAAHAADVKPIAAKPIARPAQRAPRSFQEEARMRWLRRRDAQQKRLTKLRKRDRKKQCKRRVHAKRAKRSTARARPG